MKVLVTGAYGFIAGHVVEELHAQGITVIGLARHIAGKQEEGLDGLLATHYPDQLYLGSITDKELVEKAVNSSDGVINLAGILGTQETIANPYPSVQANILGALNVLEACRLWHTPLIQITVGNYWMNNSYSITKSTTERFAQMYAIEHGVSVNVVRALNAYGPRQKAKPVRKIIASFITRALANEPIQIYGDGEQRMDMIYVEDLARILVECLLCVDQRPKGKLFEAGTGIGSTVNHLAEHIIRLTGSTSRIEHLPMRPGEPPQSEVVAQHPIAFPYTELEQGLLETIAWYQTHV